MLSEVILVIGGNTYYWRYISEVVLVIGGNTVLVIGGNRR